MNQKVIFSHHTPLIQYTMRNSLMLLLLLSFHFLSAQNYSLQIESLLKKEQSTNLDCYKNLHAHPELSTKEFNTAAYLRKTILSYGYEIIDSLGYQSFAAVLKNGNGPTILYRTEMDGLPVKEETSLPYASTVVSIKENEPFSVMHACGHDVHMTTWLGIAKVLSQFKNNWKGTLVMLAQSAEETAQGAKKLITSPNFNLIPQPTYQLAIHNNGDLKAGEVGFCDGYAMAAVDMINITIYGKGGHGAAPQNAIDPIVLSAQYINEIQTIVSRNLSPNDPAIVTVGAIHGGTAGNIIPNQVILKLTIRSYSKEARETIINRLKEIGDNLAAAAGLSKDKFPLYEILDMSIPSLYNNAELGKKIKNIIEHKFGAVVIKQVKPVMLGEDFGVYGQQLSNIPSYLLWMGTLNPEIKNTDHPVIYSPHSSHFAPFAEECIPRNISIISNCLIELFKSVN